MCIHCNINNKTQFVPINCFQKENETLQNYIYETHNKIDDGSPCGNHICMICKGKKAVCFGFNQRRVKINGFRCSSVHAEYDAVSKLGKISKKAKKRTKTYRVFIVRYKIDKETSEITYYKSDPCNQCMNLLKACKFKKIYVTTNNNNLKKIDIQKLTETYLSTIVKMLDEENPGFLHIMYRNQYTKYHKEVGKRFFE
jgi:tRNA(Arg) A34 adenosine deaminase TadA